MSSPRSARTFDPTFQTYNSDDSTNPLLHASRHRSSTTAAASAVAGFNAVSAAAEPWSSAVAMMTSDRQQFLLRYSQHHHRHHQQQQQLQQLEQQQHHQQQTTAKQRRLQMQRQHVKKPLNAFMIFMKEMRQSVIDQCTLKESAAINQILGRRVSTSGAHLLLKPCLPSRHPTGRHHRSMPGIPWYTLVYHGVYWLAVSLLIIQNVLHTNSDPMSFLVFPYINTHVLDIIVVSLSMYNDVSCTWMNLVLWMSQ